MNMKISSTLSLTTRTKWTATFLSSVTMSQQRLLITSTTNTTNSGIGVNSAANQTTEAAMSPSGGGKCFRSINTPMAKFWIPVSTAMVIDLLWPCLETKAKRKPKPKPHQGRKTPS